jgi:hydrophobe/amphiphile efflux-1 (HAE1) family protein
VSERTPRTDDLPSLSVRRPILATVMNLLIIIAGIAAILGVEVRELPNIERPIVTVRVDYPGAAPETMDAEVTRELEGAAARVPGVRSITSASEEGNARMRLYFDPSVDVNIAANDVREAVAEVERRLPDGVENLVVVKANDEAEPVVQLAAWSESLSNEQLTNLIEDRVLPTLLSVPGVADVRLYGNRARTLRVVVDPQKLASYRLSIEDVAAAMRSANLDVPAGSVETSQQNLLVRADASVVDEARIERIVIRGQTRIGDVANVFYGPAKATSYVRMNGRPVMGMSVIRQPQSNTINISNGVDRAVAQLNRQLHDIRIVKTSDDAVFIRGAVTEVLLTLVLAVAIVIGVIMLFIGSIRITLIPAVTIPVCLIGTVAAIWLLGFSVNILTLLALVLAAGLVVDDAIVVIENVERVHRNGLQRLAAAVLGTRQVFFAVIATTVTLASVFVPIAFLPGDAGPLFTEFGFVLAVAVGISSFVALTLGPMLASRLPDRRPRPGRVARRWHEGMAALGHRLLAFYERSLAAVMRAPVLTLGLSLLVAAAVGLLYRALDHELVPREDRGALLIWLQGPDGVNLNYSDRQVAQVESLLAPLRAQGEVENIFSVVGRYDLHRGYVAATLAPWGERRPQEEIAAALMPALDVIPGARASIRHPNSLSIRTGGADLEFAVTGPNYEGIAAATDRLLAALEERAPEIRDPIMEYSTTQPQLSVVIDRQRAADLGVDMTGIASTLRAMVEGLEVAELNVDDEAVPIMIESRYGEVNDTDDLRNLYVAAADGRVLPLSSLISLEESGAATELEREGQRRAIEVEAKLAPGVALNDAVARLETIAAETLPSGYNLVLLGQAQALAETGRDMAITFGIALVVVLLVLAAQFESFASALVVMVTVPFGLAAAVLALWISGTSLNIYSQIGLVMLVGLMAKNGILIVEFANQLRDQGLAVADAVHRAAAIRLRPVAMTMLSTTLAGLPLILSGGPGSEARESIGWVIFGGVGMAILTTVYVTPVVYQLLAPLARSRGDFGRLLESELAGARVTDLDEAAGAPRQSH